MRRHLALIKLYFLLPVFLLILSGCSGSVINNENPAASRTESAVKSSTAHKSKDIIITMVPKSLDNPVFLDAKEEAERTGRELGIKVEWLGSMQADSDDQEEIMESLIRRRVDGIIVSCINPGRMKEVINKAVGLGIKVATFDSDSPDSDRLFYCGTDNYAAGEACGEALIKAVKEKKVEKKTLNILIMTADERSYNLNTRLQSFRNTVQQAGLKLNVIDTLYCRDDINLAGDLLEKYMRKGADIDVFFSVGGWPLVVPTESMTAFQAWCKSGGISIVVDTYYPIVDAARKGMAYALVGQDFKKMGDLSIRNLYGAIKEENIPSKFIDTGLELGDKSNYDILLRGKKPWEIK